MKVLKGAEVFFEGKLQRLDIAFDDEGIRRIGHDLDVEGEAIDCDGLVVLPGMIDAHVHFRDFNEAHKEDWQTGGRAAVRGGVTTVLEMPNTDPPAVTAKVLREKRRRAERSPVDFGLFAGITAENLRNLPGLAREPRVVGFKLYLGETTGRLIIARRSLQKEAFQQVAETGKVLAVHAQRLGHPEASDVEIALDLAVSTGAKLHLCHLRTREGVELAYEAKRDGVDVTLETCPHYLYFTEQDAREKGALLKVNPPLASPEDRDFLWEALNEGRIDVLASDHAPHTLDEKSRPFERAPFGLPGVETTLPLMLDAVHRNQLTLARLVEVVAERPAERFGLARKGKVTEGYWADLVVVDLEKRDRVERDKLVTKCGWSPYEGFELRGWPVMTFVRGSLIHP
jgi:dihydroorotase